MKNKASLSVIFATVFIDLMGFGILIPLIPTFASKNLGMSDFEIGLVIGIYSLTQFIFNPLLGKLSDKIGRKPMIIFPLLITSLSYIIFAFSNSFFLLLVSRVVAGIGGANIGVAQAYIADITTKEDRKKGMGLIGAAFGLGFVFGPLIGGLLSKYGYDIAGYGSAAASFLAFIFAVIFLRESNTNKGETKDKKAKMFDLHFAKETLKHPAIGFLILLFFIIVFSMANIYGTFALLGSKVFNFTDQQNGYLYGVVGIVGAIMQGGAIRFLGKVFTDRTLVLLGSFFMMLGLAGIPYGQTFLGVAIVITVLGIGTGMLQPTILSLISRYAPEHKQGEILGLNHSFSALARVLGPVWGGFAFEYLGYQFPFLTGAAFVLLTFILSFFLLTSKRLKME